VSAKKKYERGRNITRGEEVRKEKKYEKRNI